MDDERSELPAGNTVDGADLYVAVPAVIPVLPLVENVVYPGALYPLTMHGAAARALLDVVRTTRTPVGLFVQRDPDQADPDLDDLYPLGTAALIYEPQVLDDGALAVMVQGLARVERGAVRATDPYLLAEVAVRPEPTLAAEQTRAAVRLAALEQQVRARYAALLAEQPPELADDLRAAAAVLDDPRQFAYLVAASAPLPVAQRQAILEADGALGKLQALLPLLAQLDAGPDDGEAAVVPALPDTAPFDYLAQVKGTKRYERIFLSFFFSS